MRGSYFFLVVFSVFCLWTMAQTAAVDPVRMEAIYNEVKTPYKYGVVIHRDTEQNRNIDCPTVFRHGDYWYMMHVQSEKDRAGYTTQLARSADLLHWERLGTILPQGNLGEWDYANAAGGIALADTEWGGKGHLGIYEGKYWLSYFGGAITGYEIAPLSIGRASATEPSAVVYWTKDKSPMLSVTDPDAGAWEDYTLYKSFIFEDPNRTLGPDARFIIFYNAKGGSSESEFIGLATSSDMRNWKRHKNNPVIVNGGPTHKISGDPQIVRINGIWVMFYFGAFWDPYPGNKSAAFDTFACSYDLVHWTKWDGPNLIEPSTSYDKTFAHKPWLIKHNGIVYHFYCAVGDQGRVIALATSVDLRQEKTMSNSLLQQNRPTANDASYSSDSQ